MKKILPILISCFLLINYSIRAQGGKKGTVWFDLGAKGGVGTTWLMNSNVFNDGYLEHNFTFGGCAGVKAGFNITNIFEITGDGLYSFFNQNYSGNDTSLNVSWNTKVNMKAWDIPVLLRLNLSGAYIEMGPQFSIISGVSESHSGNFIGVERGDVTNAFNHSYMSGVFGFGRWVGTGIDNFNMALGLRFMYGFGDILSDSGGKDNNVHFPDNDPTFPVVYDSYAPTNPFSAQFMIEFNWDLAYLINRTVCHRTTGR
ncbi:MAG: PorT family protein [Flavobacteriales bacterium]|nr:PorT family protein [Flavobacteriales bacterium]